VYVASQHCISLYPQIKINEGSMMDHAQYLAIDIGAESGRAILGQFDGERLSLHEVQRFPNIPVRLPDGLYWDILRLWADVLSGIRQAAQQYQLDSVGIDTWGVDFALLDRNGDLLGNPRHYRDERTDGIFDKAFALLPRDQIFAQTGIQFMQFNTLYQLLATVQRDPQALDNAVRFLTIPDLLNYWLTGRAVCEFSNATTTQCFNPQTRDWAWPLLEQFGIRREIFGEIVQPGTLLGKARESLNLGDLPVVAPACHDTGSAVAAVPADGKHFAWISSGTWSIMGIEVPEPVITPQSLAFNLTNEGGVDGTYRCSKNIMGLWIVQECRRTWAAQGREFSYAELTTMANEAAPLVSLIDPDDDSFLKPGDMPSRVREYCERTQQPVPQSEGALIRCVLESLALKYRWLLERLEQVADQQLDTIYVVGGGTQNTLLNQLTANATGRKVVAGPIEATAIGNLLLQARALGHIASLDELRAVVRRSFTPDTYAPQPSAEWEAAYQRLVALIA
jgi:rhamnulokinase